MSSIRAFEDFRRLFPLTPRAERLVAERVVELWQRDQRHDAGRDFLRDVEARMVDFGGRALTPEDLGL